jgi:hypothetical protein
MRQQSLSVAVAHELNQISDQVDSPTWTSAAECVDQVRQQPWHDWRRLPEPARYLRYIVEKVAEARTSAKSTLRSVGVDRCTMA